MRTLFAAFCAAIFIVSLPVALVLTNAEGLLFKSDTYKQALQTTSLYDRLPAWISGRIVSSLASSSPTTASLNFLTLSDWQTLIGVSLPPEQMRLITEQTLDRVFEYLDGKSDTISIPLVNFKQNFGLHSAEAIREILATKPACSADRLLSMAIEIAQGRQNLDAALCNPPPEILSAFLPLFSQALQSQIATLPDNLLVFQTADQPNLLPTIQRARLIMRFSLFVPLALLFFLTLFAVRSLKGFLRWWGLPFILTGALGLLAGTLSAPLTNLALLVALPSLPSLLAQLVQAVPDVFLALTHTVAVPVMTESLLILLVGAAFSLLSFLLRTPAVQSQPS